MRVHRQNEHERNRVGWLAVIEVWTELLMLDLSSLKAAAKLAVELQSQNDVLPQAGPVPVWHDAGPACFRECHLDSWLVRTGVAKA